MYRHVSCLLFSLRRADGADCTRCVRVLARREREKASERERDADARKRQPCPRQTPLLLWSASLAAVTTDADHAGTDSKNERGWVDGEYEGVGHGHLVALLCRRSTRPANLGCTPNNVPARTPELEPSSMCWRARTTWNGEFVLPRLASSAWLQAPPAGAQATARREGSRSRSAMLKKEGGRAAGSALRNENERLACAPCMCAHAHMSMLFPLASRVSLCARAACIRARARLVHACHANLRTQPRCIEPLCPSPL